MADALHLEAEIGRIDAARAIGRKDKGKIDRGVPACPAADALAQDDGAMNGREHALLLRISRALPEDRASAGGAQGAAALHGL
jgi:hypothetical protein